MPRENSQHKWQTKLSPELFYMMETDPFHICDSKEELDKALVLCDVLKHYTIDRPFIHGMDVGCGEGHFSNMYSKFCTKFDACDVSYTALKRASSIYPVISFFQRDLTEPLPKYFIHRYDLIICSEVLYYIKPEDLSIVAKYLTDMLTLGGILLVAVSQYFTYEDLESLFTGFTVKPVSKESFRDSYCLIVEVTLGKHT